MIIHANAGDDLSGAACTFNGSSQPYEDAVSKELPLLVEVISSHRQCEHGPSCCTLIPFESSEADRYRLLHCQAALYGRQSRRAGDRHHRRRTGEKPADRMNAEFLASSITDATTLYHLIATHSLWFERVRLTLELSTGLSCPDIQTPDRTRFASADEQDTAAEDVRNVVQPLSVNPAAGSRPTSSRHSAITPT